MLTVECLDWLWFQVPSHHLSVGVNLWPARLSSSFQWWVVFYYQLWWKLCFTPLVGLIPSLWLSILGHLAVSDLEWGFGPDYGTSSVKINDLSSINMVAPQGIITWHVLDAHGKEVEIQFPGYHVPSEFVHLLCLQCLLAAESSGGDHGIQDTSK